MQTRVIGSGMVAVSVWLGALVAAAPASAQQPAFSNVGRGVYDRLLKMQPAQRGGAVGGPPLSTLMVGGSGFVEVPSLTVADGRYYAAIKNAVAYLSYKPWPIVVRALFASFPIQGAIDTAAVAKDWGSRARPGSPLRLHVGGY